MSRAITAPDERSNDLRAEVDIPDAFRRAFQPTPVEQLVGLLRRVQQSLSGWCSRQREMRWLPRATDPVAELKHAWLGDYAVVPGAFAHRSPRRSVSL